ncbi:hypothetical protein L1887_28707 [Cichorium endivia]|nr:hypothetical protein L1887_28707 [Cichorium endivia]
MQIFSLAISKADDDFESIPDMWLSECFRLIQCLIPVPNSVIQLRFTTLMFNSKKEEDWITLVESEQWGLHIYREIEVL